MDIATARLLPEGLAERVRPVALARDRTLPVVAGLQPLLPAGLRRGSVVAVEAGPGAIGATSLALKLAAGPSQEGAWVVAVGTPSLGLAAAGELGVALERLVVVDAGQQRQSQLAPVVAALVDGFDVVLVGHRTARRLRRNDTRRLIARVRERGAVMVVVAQRDLGRNEWIPAAPADVSGPGPPQPELHRSAQVRLAVTASVWEGLDGGAGHLQHCRVTVETTGRAAASRPRRAELLVA